MKLFFIVACFSTNVWSLTITHWGEIHAVKRLTSKHTFLDQLCLPDKFLNHTIEEIVIMVLGRPYPAMLATIPIELQFWGHIVNVGVDPATTPTFILRNATMVKVTPPLKRADCIDVRYYASFLGDERYLNVYGYCTINIYWLT